MELTPKRPTEVAARLTVLEARTLAFWLRTSDGLDPPAGARTADAIEQARLAATADLDKLGPANFADCTSATLVQQHFVRKQAEAKLGAVVTTTLGLLDLLIITSKAEETIRRVMPRIAKPDETYDSTMRTPPDAEDPPEVHRLFGLTELTDREDIIASLRDSSVEEARVAHDILTAVDLYLAAAQPGGSDTQPNI